MMGAANNIKGIAHELKYIKEENEDGDTIFAFMPDDTSYPKFDVLNVDQSTGVQEWVQLKTTMNSQVVYDWIDKYPGAESSLRVNEEMATKLGFESTGISDKEISIEVDDFLNKLIEMDEALVSKIFMLAPPLTIIASSFAVYNLYKKYKTKDISKKQFIFLSSKITGIKATKIITLMVLLTVPVVGQVLGVYLISQLMLSAIGIFEVTKEKLLLPAPIEGGKL